MGCLGVLYLLLCVPVLCDREGAVQGLVRWIRDNGGTVHEGLSVQQGPHGLGLYGHDMSKDDYAVAIPSSLVIHPEMVLEHFYPQWRYLQLSDEGYVGLFLASERFFKGNTRKRRTLLWWALGWRTSFQPYLDSLPQRSVHNAAYWEEEDLRIAVETHYPWEVLLVVSPFSFLLFLNRCL